MIRKLFALLPSKERKQSVFLLILIMCSAILEVLGVASIFPFIALLSNPSFIESNLLINKIYLLSNLNNTQLFLFYFGVSFFLFFLMSVGLKALTIFYQYRFSLMCEYTIGKRLLQNYLGQPYSWFINHHSSDLSKNILSSVNQIINQALIPFFTLISQTTITIFIIILVCFIDMKLTIITGLILGVFYGVTYLLFFNILTQKGKRHVRNDEERFKSLNNAFGAFKAIKLGKLENFFIKKFSVPAQSYAKSQSTSLIIGQLPRYFFECIAFGGLLLIILYLMEKKDNFIEIIPILSVYVVAAYRLMPALQQLYSSISSLRFAEAAIDTVYENGVRNYDDNFTKKKLNFNNEILLKNVSYHYLDSSKVNLDNVTFKIDAKSFVAIIGPTGSGKSTLADVMLGLLEPQQGNLVIDSVIINKKNLAMWQNNIGYVPQQTFLTDQSISSNIAFGVKKELINHESVVHASKIADLHSFIINELPEKYETMIGEQGIRLSGGQRQRIGIARALYNNPNLLILDEATSALDNLTEKRIVDAIQNFKNKVTVILITHRLNSIKSCDQILLMNQGKIIASGNYKQLFKENLEFQRFVAREL